MKVRFGPAARTATLPADGPDVPAGVTPAAGAAGAPGGPVDAAGQDVEVLSGNGTVDRLADVVAAFAPRRVLVVGSRSGIVRAGVPERLRGCVRRYFTGFTPNPQFVDVLTGAALVSSYRPDLILGVGGGSALDVAKMVRLLPPGHDDALAMLTGDRPDETGSADGRPPAPLVLVPTTAGTGAEVTRFATVYRDGVKHSLDSPRARADVALVDPGLTFSCPPDVTFSCALDALAHAIESTWSTRSTPQSRALAADALSALVQVLAGCEWPLSRDARVVLSIAATRAGLAIDITRTTAAHAFAYPLTSRYGVRHGLACALNLTWLLPLTARRLRLDCQDRRGVAFVERRLHEIAAGLGAAGPADSGAVVNSFVIRAGFVPGLAGHGVAEADLPWLVQAGLGSVRSATGPVRLEPDAVRERLTAELAGQVRH